MKKYGSTAEHFAKIGYKNHKHSVNNPYAQFQDEYSLDDILGARMISDPLTKLQCSPTSDGSGAAIVASVHRSLPVSRGLLTCSRVRADAPGRRSTSSLRMTGSRSRML